MNEGMPLKYAGLAQVASHNEEWLRAVRAVAHAIAVVNGCVSADDLRTWADENDMHPVHPNAWGAIFREPRWRPVAYKVSTYPSNHARIIRVWEFVHE